MSGICYIRVIHIPPTMQTQTKVCLFIRVSTAMQDYNRQISDLTNYCQQKGLQIAKVIATKITGKKTLADRHDLQELLSGANRGEFEKVLVTEISRLGRNARDIRNTIDQLHRKKIAVVFHNLGGLESLDDNGNESLATNIIVAVFSEISQNETKLLSERIKSGLAEAKRKGKKIGRPIGGDDINTVKKKYSKLITDMKKGNALSLSELSKLHDVSRNTVIKIKKLIAA